MLISFQCPECANSFNVGNELAGKEVRCKCGADIQVPQPAAPAQQQPVYPLLSPRSSGQKLFDPLMGSVTSAEQPVATAEAGREDLHIGVTVGAGVGGVVVLGLLLWLMISLVGVGTETGIGVMSQHWVEPSRSANSQSARSPQPPARFLQPPARSPQPRQNAHQLATRHVERLLANAKANGDIEKFLEYQGILGAIAALQTGDSRLLRLFGPDSCSRAQGYINMYKN